MDKNTYTLKLLKGTVLKLEDHPVKVVKSGTITVQIMEDEDVSPDSKS